MRTPLMRFVRFIVCTFLLYGAALLICHFVLERSQLIDLVSSCKIVSLGVLIVVSEGITRDIDPKKNKAVKRFSHTIALMSLGLVVLLVLSLLKLDFQQTALRPSLQTPFARLLEQVSYLAMCPLIAYAVLNFWVGFLRRDDTHIYTYARCYFVFADCTCVIPLLFVVIVPWFAGVSTSTESHVFFSGAVAVIVFTSNTVSKALEEFVDDETAQRIAARLGPKRA